MFGGHDAIFQCGHREEWLDRRAGRVGAAQRAVDERLVDIVLQGVELLGREAARERVGIESRRAGEGDDVARVRIDGDGRAAFARQSLLCGPLHAHVDAEDQIRAGDGLAYIQFGRKGPLAFDRPAGRIDQHFAVSRGSVQQALVGAFDP